MQVHGKPEPMDTDPELKLGSLNALVAFCMCRTLLPRVTSSCADLHAGGACLSQCPTKTHPVHGDIWPDQPDVPAFGLASGPPVALE